MKERFLEKLHGLWLAKDDSSYMEMEKHVEDEIEKFAKKGQGDDANGNLQE